jgi:type IX secretion system PorP/SprF family membrane protein
MKGIKQFFWGGLLASAAFSAQGQDFHYSQFYNAPLMLNPGLTGKIKEDFRVGLIHRSQWKAVNSAYLTSSVFADINFIKNPFKLDSWGVGVFALNDELGDGIFSNQQVALSLSGTKTLDELKRHRITVGIQPNYITKGLNASSQVFDNQINGSYQIDKNISSGESLNNRYSFFNLNAGAFYDFVLNKKIELFAGYSMNNILRPNEKPLTTGQSQLPIRHAFNPGFTYTFTPKWAVTPSVLFMYQATASDVNMGLNAAYTFNPEKSTPTTAYLGTWFRAKDAFIAMAGLKWGHYKVAFSYDFTVSKFRDVKKGTDLNNATVGAWEISFIYVGFLKRALPNETTIPCKFF